jgi:hypothetical protein
MQYRESKKSALQLLNTYIYDEQEHIQGTHGTIYNLKFSSAFSPRVCYRLMYRGQSNQYNILENNFNKVCRTPLKKGTNIQAYNHIGG